MVEAAAVAEELELDYQRSAPTNTAPCLGA